MSGYPLVLVGLENSRCVVIGGGQVAARKVAALQAAGARPVVISPALCTDLECQAGTGTIDAVRRFYEPGDLDGAWLVIAATDDEAINEAVWRGAQARGCLVNVVDDPARCNFHVPAVVRRGELIIAISTGGNSPSLARRARQALEEEFDGAYEPYLALLGELRPLIQAQVTDATRRKALWAALLDSEILGLLRSGASEAARRCAQEIIEAYS